MSIRRLPNGIIDKIKSSSHIVSLNGAVRELAKNSLDAGASKITIHLDYVRGNCTVEDDGKGIAAEEFGADGGLAKPNCTSRFPDSSNYHGRYGNFLASLAALSLLIITSTTGEKELQKSLAIHHGTTIPSQSITPVQRLSFSRGTQVAVFDLFGSMPVRVKHRASAFSTPSYIEKEFKILTYELTALLLAWPAGVSVFLSEVKPDSRLRMSSLDGLTLQQQTSRLLIQAGLSDSMEASSWIPVAASNDNISVEGCISTIPVASRKSQFISIGVHPLEQSLGGNVLLDEINEIFSSSSFGFTEDTGLPETPAASDTTTQAKHRKSLEKWPMLYLRFECRNLAMGDNCLFRPRNPHLVTIISLLRAVCYAFLRKYKMRPRKLVYEKQNLAQKEEERPSTSQRVQYSISTPAKSGNPLNQFDDGRRIKASTLVGLSLPPLEADSQHAVSSDGQLLRKPFLEEFSKGPCAGDLCCDAESHSPVHELAKVCETLETHGAGGTTEWLERLLQSWKNPVFETSERAVRRLYSDSNSDICKDGGRFSASSSNTDVQISKSALKKAEILAQVDNKFVLIKVPVASAAEGNASPGSHIRHALFAVDQHAADERCRLEQLMAGYFEQVFGKTKVVLEHLDQPISWSISAKEAIMFARSQSLWAGWGIIYQMLDVGSSSKQDAQRGILVTDLPPSILERCRGEPQLLMDILRRGIFGVSEDISIGLGKEVPSPSFQGCPRGILELLHSRACRTAIMFNDELTLAECTSLIRRLSQCSLPFQCAHGRPSMAPLLDLGHNNYNVLRTTPGVTFQDSNALSVMNNFEAWRRWMS